MKKGTMKKGTNPFKNAALCTQCGYCLPVCPTYRVENNELHSPRGRVSILLALQSADLSVAEAASALDHCLVCRACHAACPADVRPAKLALTLRSMVTPRPNLFSALFHGICSNHKLTAKLSTIISFYQQSGLQQLIRRFGLLRLFPALALLEYLIPRHRPKEPQPPPLWQEKRDTQTAETPSTQPLKRVGLLCGCMARIFFPGVEASATQLLASLGFEVVILKEFGCCGAPFRESGDRKAFLRQARRTLDAFMAARSLDAIVCDSSVCAVTAHSYARALANDAIYATAAQEFSSKTATFSQFLTRFLELKPKDNPTQSSPDNRQAQTVVASAKDPGFGSLTYHDHCQTRYGSGIIAEPRSLLAALPVTYHELPHTTHTSGHGCCGTGGDYLLRHPKRSQKILQDTLAAIRESGADTVVGENPGCLLNIASGLEQTHSAIRVRHLAEVLWAAHLSKPPLVRK